MTNIYHIIDFIPGLEKEEMLRGYEELAHKLVESGRLRIDAGAKVNFARLYVPNLRISMMFSRRELYDANLLEKTLAAIGDELSQRYRGKDLESKKKQFFKMLLGEINKYPQPSEEEELKLARLVVQASHPIVTMLALLENAEIYVSHSYNIGDTLDIITWQAAGENSGMQSTNGKDIAIFISCGGDPLTPNQEKNAFYGDGWPAIARLLVIGGQELGHYSDIMRNKNGKQVSRYSANFSATRAKENVRVGRINDIQNAKSLLQTLESCGLSELVTSEGHLKFYSKNNKISWVFLREMVRAKMRKISFFRKAKEQKKFFLKRFYSEKYPGIILKAMIDDMLFNLSPQADVYKREDKDAEEAIACVEALARVPQQVNKWGHRATQALMSNLYKIYYGTVIPGCIESYSSITGKPFSFDRRPVETSLIYKIKALFKKREWPTREVE